MSGRGVGSTPTNNLSHTQFSTSNAEVDTPATPRRSSSSRSQHPSANMPSPRASQDGTEMGVISRPQSAVTRSRTSLYGMQPALGASSEQVGPISGDDVERALSIIANEPPPPHVDTPASLWQHVTNRLQVILGGAVTAGVTFGAFRGLGSIAEHTTSSSFGEQVATQMKSVLIGGAAAGFGNTLAATALTPAAVALLGKLLGTSTALVPERAEDLVPEGSPNRQGQIDAIKAAQARFGVDSLVNISTGVLSFAGVHAARGEVTANAHLSPVAGYGASAGGSAIAGGLTGLLTTTLQARNQFTVEGPGGQRQTFRLFKHVSKPPASVGTAVSTATQGFLAGRQGMQAVGHVASQIGQRAVTVTASTVGFGLTQAAIPAVRNALERHGQSPENANAHANAAMNALGFTMVVIAYFTLLGKIAGTIPQRNPQPPGLPR